MGRAAVLIGVGAAGTASGFNVESGRRTPGPGSPCAASEAFGLCRRGGPDSEGRFPGLGGCGILDISSILRTDWLDNVPRLFYCVHTRIHAASMSLFCPATMSKSRTC